MTCATLLIPYLCKILMKAMSGCLGGWMENQMKIMSLCLMMMMA
ncbi:hypothetical protein CsSME_00029159 [Camellia sinensis var. sinensis]